MSDAGRDRGRIAEVLLPVPVSRPYRYFVPGALAPRAVVGARVVVPVQRRRVIGVVLGVDDGTPDRALKPVADAPDAEPALSPALLELGRWISRYYGTPLGLAMRALLPGALWGVRRPAGPAERVERVVTLAGALPSPRLTGSSARGWRATSASPGSGIRSPTCRLRRRSRPPTTSGASSPKSPPSRPTRLP